MSNFNTIYSIVVPAGEISGNTEVNLTAHTYNQIYGGSAGCSIIVNSVPITMGGSSSINLNIRTISGGTGCFLLGENKNVSTGSMIIG